MIFLLEEENDVRKICFNYSSMRHHKMWGQKRYLSDYLYFVMRWSN